VCNMARSVIGPLFVGVSGVAQPALDVSQVRSVCITEMVGVDDDGRHVALGGGPSRMCRTSSLGSMAVDATQAAPRGGEAALTVSALGAGENAVVDRERCVVDGPVAMMPLLCSRAYKRACATDVRSSSVLSHCREMNTTSVYEGTDEVPLPQELPPLLSPSLAQVNDLSLVADVVRETKVAIPVGAAWTELRGPSVRVLRIL
jgi:hypothetical protein